MFAEALSRSFHLTPFKKVISKVNDPSIYLTLFYKVWWSPRTGEEQQVYDELYTLDTWNEAQDNIMKQRRSDGCKLERVVAAMMLWSDSTCLAAFGHASAWPIYLLFGNLSKYARSRPEGGACNPIAFISRVSFLPTCAPFLRSHWLSASRNYLQVHIRYIRHKKHCGALSPLQTGTRPCCLEGSAQQQLC